MNYKIFGPNEDRDEVHLGSETGPVPNVGDTISINGEARKVKKVWSDHKNGTAEICVRVSQYDDGRPLPFLRG